MTDVDFGAAADLQAAIEAAGGELVDFQTTQQDPQGLAQAIPAMLAGDGRTVYQFDVVVDGPTSADVPDQDATVDVTDALEAVAIAASWANAQGFDALEADLTGIGERMAEQAQTRNRPDPSDLADFDDPDGAGSR